MAHSGVMQALHPDDIGVYTEYMPCVLDVASAPTVGMVTLSG